ncbi:hypothetical protein [Allocoleopsis franciscana]|uniref:Uncharacterized protein n=1 Tax=Allocoleopsis franciscana PCC 7113 TaxID=1173027 RepID=K9WKF5_9CYAN|nr:hypothetical protein [Allocoleopsis franciscana]AFZ20254.1 hypothetical protein Mic7113_4572 [Allocoleopsis franciscana PCC 7113]
MVRIVVLLALAINAGCSSLPVTQTKDLQISPMKETTMSYTTNISIKNITLQAREEKTPPDGVPNKQNRDIGFASVFLRLENAKEEDVSLTVQRVEIRNTVDGNVQLSDSSPQQIRLRPLENSEVVFHLTNKTGYSKHNQVKAVITYTIGDHLQVIESTPVEVERS